jgi:hypothetical protein
MSVHILSDSLLFTNHPITWSYVSKQLKALLNKPRKNKKHPVLNPIKF